jgi:hypothetical protein
MYAGGSMAMILWQRQRWFETGLVVGYVLIGLGRWIKTCFKERQIFDDVLFHLLTRLF